MAPPAPPASADDDRAADAVATKDAAFDDVMLAMDIVDTMRHRALVAERALDAGAREEALINRLREIYAAQGISVPDHILKDGVNALEEGRFAYEPKKGGLQFALARAYIARDRWLKPFAAIVAAATIVTGGYEMAVRGPQARAEARIEIELTETLPAQLEQKRDVALALAATDAARTRIETSYQDGVAATADRDVDAARASVADLEALQGDLQRNLTIRVVSRPGERSGVFRIPNDARDARNYYLIVEAVDASGRARSLEIASEEDQTRKRASVWGVRVPEGEYNRVAADKQDDQIIQNAVVGRKPTGHLTPDYSIPTAGGAILEW